MNTHPHPSTTPRNKRKIGRNCWGVKGGGGMTATSLVGETLWGGFPGDTFGLSIPGLAAFIFQREATTVEFVLILAREGQLDH